MITLIALRIALGIIPIPVALLDTANLIVSILFVAIPIVGIFAGSSLRWTWATAAVSVLVGGAIQILAPLTLSKSSTALQAGITLSVAQTALLVWVLGLGVLIAILIRDRNLLLPISIFLGLFDIWLVFAPEGPVGKIARGNQKMLANIAYQVPQAAAQAREGLAAPMIYIGPADFLFTAMFFVALHRFGMRVRETAVALVPTLITYLIVVLKFGYISLGPISLRALPALLPIGLVVLWVNRREFKLTKDEKITTVALAILGIGLVGWRLAVAKPEAVQVPRAEPATQESVPTPQAPGATPLQVGQDQSPSQSPVAPADTPRPR